MEITHGQTSTTANEAQTVPSFAVLSTREGGEQNSNEINSRILHCNISATTNIRRENPASNFIGSLYSLKLKPFSLAIDDNGDLLNTADVYNAVNRQLNVIPDKDSTEEEILFDIVHQAQQRAKEHESDFLLDHINGKVVPVLKYSPQFAYDMHLFDLSVILEQTLLIDRDHLAYLLKRLLKLSCIDTFDVLYEQFKMKFDDDLGYYEEEDDHVEYEKLIAKGELAMAVNGTNKKIKSILSKAKKLVTKKFFEKRKAIQLV